MMRLIALALILLACAGQAGATEAHVTRNISYGPERLQTLDVYSPDRCRACPIVLWVHGGGWRMGSKDMPGTADLAQAWTSAGAIVVAVNYRLSPDVVHPAHVQDIAASIDWVRQNIEPYGGDKSRLFLLGHSAGAHLVALVATDPRYLAAYGLHPADVLSGVFPIDSASYDLTESINDRFVGRMVAQAFGTNERALAAASPLEIVRQNRTGRYPPFTMAAVKIRRNAVEQMNDLAGQLQRAGGTAYTLVVDYATERSQLKAHAQIARDLANPNHAMTQRLMREVGLQP